MKRLCILQALGTLGFAALNLFCGSAPALSQDDATPNTEVTIAQTRFPLDLSYLNHKPAGALGRVRAEGEALVFGDGSPARFWGVNIQANALFRAKNGDIGLHAERLARMGVNLVRLHHHDSHWVKPNIFGTDPLHGGQIDRSSMARVDRWVASLRAQGIYIWLDLHVGRRLDAGDEVADLEEITQGKHEGDLRGFNYVNDDIKTEMQRFTEAYLNHVNLHTGLAYKDDPAVMAVLVTNENGLTKHFANRLLPDKDAPGHAQRYMAQAARFAQNWGLDPQQVWKAWEFGPAKLFLADLEHRFYADMTAHLRQIGYDGLIASSNFWGGVPLATLPALTAGNLIDVHSYGQNEDIFADPATQADMLSNIAAAHVSGMPLTVSEWNIERFRSPDRLFAPLRLAAMAAFQEWDAMMLYGYAQRSLKGKPGIGKWHGTNDPSIIATLPAAALMYRQGHVPPAATQYILRPSAEQLFGAPLDAQTLAPLRSMPERVGLRIALPATSQLPWLAATKDVPGARIIEDFEQDVFALLPADGSTPPFRRDPQRGLFTVDTGQAQVVAGHLNKRPASTSQLDVTLAHDRAMVAVQSADQRDLADTETVLLSVAVPSYQQEGMKLPFKSKPLNGVVSFEAAPALRLREVVPKAGQAYVLHRQKGGRHILSFQDAPGALWLVFGR